MREDLDRLLCERYPKMFAERYGSPHETAMCWGFECSDGWFDLIDTLCGSIQRYIDQNSRPNNEIPQVIVEQVKEKFGGLRFYTRGGDRLTSGMTWMAEEMSYKICEICGQPGSRRGNGWIYTACDAHAKDEDK